MRQFFFRSAVVSVAVLSFLASGCLVSPQAPVEIFADRNTLPAELNAIANPRPSSAQTKAILEKDLTGRLAVAVVDEGVDYRHASLYQQIRFRTVDGKVAGAGFDFMGRDGWGHPALIEPQLYALTAETVENARLKGVSGDPLTWILSTQKKFAALLKAELQKSPKFMAHWMSKRWNDDTLFFFAAPGFVKRIQETEEDRKELAEKAMLIQENSLQNTKHVKKYAEEALKELFESPWIGAGGGAPDERFDLLLSVEGVELLIEPVQAAYAALNQEERLAQRAENFKKYVNQILDQSSGSSLDDIFSAWQSVRFGYAFQTPIIEFLRSVCDWLPKDVSDQLPAAKYAERFPLVGAELKRQLAIFSRIYKVAHDTPGLTEEDKRHFEESAKGLPRIERQFQELVQTRPYLARYMTCEKSLDRIAVKDAGLTNYQEKRAHPYLNSRDSGSSHGTHVSGIIARQSKKIDIVPIRVVTASSAKIPVTSDRLRRNFEKGFAAWSSNPVVRNAIRASLKKYFGKELSPEEFAQKMEDHLNRTFSSNYLDYQFFDQINAAIRAIGNEKIKVANLSLGTSFERALLDPNPASQAAQWKSFMGFWVYEYFKYAVASTVERYAANTLFVIASGNDSAWVDGKARSALPCDLSSPVISESVKQLAGGNAAAAAAQDMPNNRLKNILCVGSISKLGDLSPFMNIPFSNVPFVVSYGESVLSPVKLTDCEGIAFDIRATYGNAISFALLPDDQEDDGRFDPYFKELGLITQPKDGELTEPQLKVMRARAAMRFYIRMISMSDGVEEAITQSRCMLTKRPYARMSGTSMATPAVAGFIAKSVVAEMNRQGLTEEQVYASPEFSPERLIQLVRERSPVFGGQTILKDLSTVTDIKDWKAEKLRNLLGVVSLEQLAPPTPEAQAATNGVK